MNPDQIPLVLAPGLQFWSASTGGIHPSILHPPFVHRD